MPSKLLAQFVDACVTERAFMATVIELAHLYRWHCYHTHDSRRSEFGWPDLVLCRPPRLLFAELKTERGKLTSAQESWLEALRACPGTEVYCWRPSDWHDIERGLRP